ncbi:MAG: polyprenol monophosphomannose synthase [Bacteroidales bacterium]|nr:polyprenol monophosphomannose synthase [Bacteroidales bacterium]MDI9576445.1 polyprenol monophosphomannose synthase [Bacteroidota bacterium]MDD3755406.1 polyprenol monophosphomannose synthase [Bacteroidales bacterium]MDY0400390.1 polyprenol monophosphomannose synthase [Bacteroidales bacterium]HOB76873.1 polyprenol monophosphomannose synthase [Bacteroidales bacterium]
MHKIFFVHNQAIVIIPTYNEKENIESIIRTVFSLPEPFDILVVDDNSPDGTSDIVKSLIDEFPDNLNLLLREKKEGLGRAYIAGFKWALEHNYEYILEMDADFSHNPEDLVRLLATCRDDNYDLSIGSRYVSGITVMNWPLSRVLLSYFASKYVNIITGMPVKDSTAGFVCYKASFLSSIDLDKISFIGYAFQIEMKYYAYKLGFKIKEIPIIFSERQHGQSKMNKKIVFEAMWGVIQMRFRNVKKLLKK